MPTPEGLLRIAFAPWMVAGIRTQWENLLPHILARPDIVPVIAEIVPYRPGGALEALPFLPNKVAGNLRSLQSTLPAQPGLFVYPGFSPNDPGLRELHARCDLFVLPTRADCFSLAGLEAMASGLPVIISAVGGIPKIVVDGVSGALIAPGDGAALAARIDVLLDQPKRWAAIGLEGRRIVEARVDAAKTTARLLDRIVAVARAGRRWRALP